MPLNLKNAKVSLDHFISLRDRVDMILGVGAADKGYGQTLTSTVPAVDPSLKYKVSVDQWENLAIDINKALKHQMGAGTPYNNAKLAESLPKYHKLTGALVDVYDAALISIETNYSQAAASEMLTAPLGSAFTNAVQWGSNTADTLRLTQTFTFASADAARFFFNSGGYLSVSLSHPYTSGTNNAYWNEALTKAGMITLAGNATTTTGMGTGSSIGFHQLTTTSTSLYTFTFLQSSSSYSGSSTYTGGNNKLTIRGSLNAAGTVVTLVTELLDVMGGIGNDVAAGTAAQFSYRKSAYFTIATPTINSSAAWVISDNTSSNAVS